jgi:hypothetical protein
MAKASTKGRRSASGTAKKQSARKGVISAPASGSATVRAASLLKAQMPNWKVVKSAPLFEAAGAGDMKTDGGPSIQALRVKFLGQRDAAGGAVLADVDESVRTVRIQPKGGGSPKTADIRNGKVTIVQG